MNTDKITGFFHNRVSPLVSKLGENYYLQTITATMMATLGIVLIGSIAVLLMAFPIPSVTSFINSVELTPVLNAIHTYTINGLSIYVAFLMAKNLTTKFLPNEDGNAAGIASLMSFLVVTPLGNTVEEVAAIPTTWLGAQGLFSAIIIGLAVGRIFVFIKTKGWTIKMPESVPPMVSRVFEGLIPTIVIGILFIIISWFFQTTTYDNFHQFVYSIIQQPLTAIGGTLTAFLIATIVQQLLWFFGVHGTNVIIPIVTPIWISMDMENLAALAAGEPLPHILGLTFFNVITWGGLGIGLVILMIISKSKQYKELGKIALVPSLFGITEPLIFGTPLVLNFRLAIPFITNNAITITLAYLLIKFEIVSKFSGAQAIFGLPLGFHASVGGAMSIIILQLILQLVLSPILWYPWFKGLEKEALKRELEEETAA